MNRLLAAIRNDVVLQYRNGLYVITAVLGLFLVLFVRALIPREWYPIALPLGILSLLGIHVFYMAGIVWLERNQNVLDSLITSPLRHYEYLLSKALSLLVLGLAEAAAMTAAIYGLGLNWPPVLMGSAMLVLMFAWSGLAIALPHASFSAFLIPGIVLTLVAELPFLHRLQIVESPLMYALPTMPPLLLLEAGFREAGPGELLYAYAYSALVLLAAYGWAHWRFQYYIVEGRAA